MCIFSAYAFFCYMLGVIWLICRGTVTALCSYFCAHASCTSAFAGKEKELNRHNVEIIVFTRQGSATSIVGRPNCRDVYRQRQDSDVDVLFCHYKYGQ